MGTVQDRISAARAAMRMRGGGSGILTVIERDTMNMMHQNSQDVPERLLVEDRQNPFMERNGIITEEMRRDYVRLSAELRQDLCNPYGRAHGGLLFTMQDCCSGMTARTDGRDYVTLDANIHYVANITEGRMIAESHIVSRTRRLCVVRVDIRDESGRQLTEGTVTMYCVSRGA